MYYINYNGRRSSLRSLRFGSFSIAKHPDEHTPQRLHQKLRDRNVRGGEHDEDQRHPDAHDAERPATAVIRLEV